MILNNNSERSEGYRVLASLFSEVPDPEILTTLMEDFGLESREAHGEIEADFESLLRYPHGSLPPLETEYISQAPMAMSMDVADYYQLAGLTIDEDSFLPPDHLTLEFFFMSYLIENNLYELQKKFLEEHLLNWVPYYCGEIKVRARTVFYRELALITEDFLNADYDDNFSQWV